MTTYDDVPPYSWSGVTNPPPKGVSMDPGVKQLWCDALRSGQYAQTFHRLRDDDGFDPYGVLADLATTHVDGMVWEHMEEEGWFLPGGFKTGLSPAVREWARIKGSHPSEDVALFWNNDWHPLWRLNDHYKVPFDVLALLIEAQY